MAEDGGVSVDVGAVRVVAARAAAKRRDSLCRLLPVAEQAAIQAKNLCDERDGQRDRAKIVEQEMSVRTGGSQAFWPTPYPLARRMVEEANIQPGMSVLEPSAGTGRLADMIKKLTGIAPICVELFLVCSAVLKEKGYEVIKIDFCGYEPGLYYDRILMNPPFADSKDVDHVQHAYRLLAPGGRLVAIMSEHSFFSSHRVDAAFCAWLEDVGGTSEQLPADTFNSSGTGVQTRLVIINKETA
jgi:hypothetical protein